MLHLNLITLVAVALGGALGALLRLLLRQASLSWWGAGFPWGTLLANGLGSFTAGLLFSLFSQAIWDLPEAWRSGLMIGLLGALTTFSTFSVDILQMVQQQEWGKAMINLSANVGISLGAVFVGAWLGGRMAP